MIAFGACALLALAGTMFSHAAGTCDGRDGGQGGVRDGQTVTVPADIKEKVIQAAIDNNLVTREEADILTGTDAIQQCVDALMGSGCDPKAAVDRLAEIAVASGKASDKAQAKARMKAAAEEMRKDGSMWQALYDLLGL